MIYLVYFIILWGLLLGLLRPNTRGSSFTSFGGSKKLYEDLVSYLINPKLEQVPRYKFFTGIIEKLNFYQKHYGLCTQSSFRQIRKAIVFDYKEEKKLCSVISGTYFQYILLVSFIWFYFYQVTLSLDLSLGALVTEVLVGVHIFGMVLLGAGLTVIRKSLFSSYKDYFCSAYNFKVLLTVSRPITEVIKVCQLERLSQQKKFISLHRRFVQLTSQLKTQGTIPLDESENLIQELWDQYEIDLEKFNRLAQVLKLTVMCIIILPSFLFIMYQVTTKLVL